MTLDLKPQLGLLHMIEQRENGCLNQKNIFDNVIAAYLLNPLKNEYPYEDIAKDYCSLMIPSRVDLLGKSGYDLAMDEKPEGFLKTVCFMAVLVLRYRLATTVANYICYLIFSCCYGF